MLQKVFMKKIKLFATDVDGTLTDGRFTIDSFGNETKTFNVKDGMAINILKSRGVKIAVLTNHKSEVVKQRFDILNVDWYFDNCSDKLSVIQKIASEEKITLCEIAFIGDDINDLPTLKAVGESGCPSDAVEIVKSVCKFVSTKNGGYGCMREYVEELIKCQKL